MTRTGITGLMLAAMFALSAISATPSSAACFKVITGEKSSYSENRCQTPVSEGGYIKGKLMGAIRLSPTQLCVEVGVGEPSNYSEDECRTQRAGGGWAKVIKPPPVVLVAPPGKYPDKSTSKANGIRLESSGGEKIECTAEAGSGAVAGETLIDKLLEKLTGCTATKGSEKCTVKSTGAANAGEILFHTLKGETGEVAPLEATSETGLYLTPESGKVFTTPEGSCLTTAAIEGSLAGEFTPIGSLSTTEKLVFNGKGGTQSIKKISVKGSSKSPSLEAFGLVETDEAATEEVSFAEAVEVL
jgi:hypothetical protein